MSSPTCDVEQSAALIARRIALLRGQKVILDADLAALYGVETRRLNEQVRRNPERFPRDFTFVLTPEEFSALMSQFATSKPVGEVGASCHWRLLNTAH